MDDNEVHLSSEKIINIGIFAHVDAGKTTLTEQILLACGRIRQAGSVDNGTAQTDFLTVERERGISVMAATTDIEWRGCHINIIDTPGHIDFAGETERVLRVLDGAVLVVSAVEGIQSHTENLWRAFSFFGIPCIVFINKIDRVGSSAHAVCDALYGLENLNPVVISEISDEGTRFCSVRAKFPGDAELTELLAEISDEMAEDYINGVIPAHDRLIGEFTRAVHERKITPVLFGSSLMSVGTEEVLDAIISYLPPASRRLCGNLSGLIFKIEHDKSMGKIAHVRMFGGCIRNRDPVVINEDVDGEGTLLPPQKVTQIRKFSGSRFVDVGSVGAGDIAALCGLTRARVFDTIGEYKMNSGYRLANPYLTVRVSPEDPAQLTALLSAVKELCDEDPLIDYKWEPSEREINISITGDIQREIIGVLLKERYGLSASFSPPSVIYRETPARSGEGFEAYTMPKPCWAVVRLGIEPLPRGSGVIYDGGKVPNNKLFYKYQSHIKSSVYSSIEQGNYGWELTDIKITLLDGEHHTIHTHPLDFFVATPMALMDGIRNTGTLLLEPMLDARITVPENLMGHVISDITVMRGEFDSPVIKNGRCTIECRLPVSTTLDYPVRLAALSSGRAVYSTRFGGYRECPLELGAVAKRRGINPLDRSKWILYARGAIQPDTLPGKRGRY